jgi:hypothetical protein
MVASIFAIGGFLVGSSSSQEGRRGADGEVGRYQMVAPHSVSLFIFDTKTARYWNKDHDGDWKAHLGPFAGRAKPQADGPGDK